MPFDTLKDLQAVALLFRTPLVLVVDPNLPVKSVAELIALLKQKPGEINFGHSGAGSAIHLAAELFQTMTGTKMNGVAYRGAPPALNDVMAGHVALMFADAGSVMAADQRRYGAARSAWLRRSAFRHCPMCRPLPKPACRASTRSAGR